MKLRLTILFLLSLLIIFTDGSAQKWKLKRYEGIVGFGTAHYFGDIGGAQTEENLFGIKDIEIKGTRPSLYLGARYKIRQNIAIKANFIYGFLTGEDEGSKLSDRNYSFTSNIFEPSVQVEYSIISEEQRYRSSAMFNRRGMINNFSKFNVYAFAGIGGVISKAKQTGEIPYRPIDNVKEKSFGLAFPMGIGGKFILSSYWSIGAEFGGRLTTNDFLDGFATDFSKHNDVYYFLTLQAIYRIRTSREGYPIIFNRRRRSFF